MIKLQNMSGRLRIHNRGGIALQTGMEVLTMENKLMKPELLAPVGGKPHLIAAVNNGADAVYMGGMAFNARIFADNFSDEELPDAIRYAHMRGVKVYMTLNTLVRDDELVRAFEYANYIYGIGVDGLIVQDLGLARMLHKYIPEMPLHLSTQGTLYNKEAVKLAHEMGFCRVVPAREISLEEIRELADEGVRVSPDKPVDIEVFVHGALCMCYSGQCQMSRMMGKGSGRTGNRGTCAQPCRQAYTDDQGRTYYALSPKDICHIYNIPDLVMAGAGSFKIEGRMKSPEYVATVTRIYRKYIDRFDSLVRKFGPEEAKKKYTVDDEDMFELRQIFNRGDFTDGYLYGNPGEDILSGSSPKNQGIYLGRIVAVVDTESKAQEKDEKAAVCGALRRGKVLACVAVDRQSEVTVDLGDGLEFRRDDGDYLVSAPIGSVTTFIKEIGKGIILVGDFDRGIETGDLAFKVTDRKLIEEALDAPEKKLPATMLFTAREGQYPRLVMTDVKAGESVEITADHVIERAQKVATDASRIADNLSRLGDTPYTPGMTGIDVEIDDDIMVPLSIVNRMRREASEELMHRRAHAVTENRAPRLSRAELDIAESKEMLGAEELDIDRYKAKLAGRAVQPVPIEEFMRAKQAGDAGRLAGNTKVLPYILNVSKGSLDAFIRENFDEIVKAVKDTGILIGNLGWIRQFAAAGVKVYGDYGLNVFNEQARKALEDFGVELYMPSHETGVSDVRGIPLMITEHPVQAEYLTDRKGMNHAIRTAASGDKTLIF